MEAVEDIIIPPMGHKTPFLFLDPFVQDCHLLIVSPFWESCRILGCLLLGNLHFGTCKFYYRLLAFRYFPILIIFFSISLFSCLQLIFWLFFLLFLHSLLFFPLPSLLCFPFPSFLLSPLSFLRLFFFLWSFRALVFKFH